MITNSVALVAVGWGILNTAAGHIYRQCLGEKSIDVCLQKIISSPGLDQGVQMFNTTKLDGMRPDFLEGVLVTLAGYKSWKCLTELYHTLRDPQLALIAKVQKSALPALYVVTGGVCIYNSLNK